MERSNRHFGERPYGKVDFHTWERKPGALAGFIIGLGVSLDGETSLQPLHFTRNLCSERNQCREFSDLEGWQDTSSAQTWGQLFRKSLSAGILESWRGMAPTWQQWCHQLHGWVMWNLCRVLGNVPPVLLPAEGCFPGLCLPLKTKPGDSYPTGTHSLPRELSFAPLSQQQPEHSIVWAFHSCLSRARDQGPVWGCYSKSSFTIPILVPPLSLLQWSWLCLQGDISCFLIYYLL